MERYTDAELADMHQVYDASNCYGRATHRFCAKCYSRKHTPRHTFFSHLHQRMSDSGSFIVDTKERQRRIRTPNNEETMRDLNRTITIPVR
ncbi:DUF4817 domain-containing protein [Trichonephila clavipes]|nr:DUF4817 domain-containing protein [Trichonephila clavipes]